MFTFSEKSQILLRDIGWYPDRKVDPSIGINNLQQVGYTVFDTARQIMEHLGGLHSNKVSPSILSDFITLSDNTKIHFATHPVFDFIADFAPYIDAESYWLQHSFIKRNHLEICPIGSLRGITTLFIVSDGRIFTGEFYAPKSYGDDKQASLIFLGNRIDEAIDKLTERCIGYL